LIKFWAKGKFTKKELNFGQIQQKFGGKKIDLKQLQNDEKELNSKATDFPQISKDFVLKDKN